MQELFDIPEEYEAMLNKGIGLTGNDRHFFIRGRFDFMGRFLKNRPPETILDFGCGTGDASAELAARHPGAQVFAWDPAERALAFANDKHRYAGLSFISEETMLQMQFDLIFLNCVLHHIRPEHRQETVDKLAGLLSPGGSLWIFENNPLNPGTRWAMYRNPFDDGVVKVWPRQLGKMMKKAGLAIRGRGFLFYFPQWLAWFRPLEQFLHALPLGGQYAFHATKLPRP